MVEPKFAYHGADVFHYTAVSRGVVGSHQVVVNRLGDADDTHFMAFFLSQLGDFVRGVLGVIASDVKEISNFVGLKNFQHALEVLVFLQ